MILIFFSNLSHPILVLILITKDSMARIETAFIKIFQFINCICTFLEEELKRLVEDRKKDVATVRIGPADMDLQLASLACERLNEKRK